ACRERPTIVHKAARVKEASPISVPGARSTRCGATASNTAPCCPSWWSAKHESTASTAASSAVGATLPRGRSGWVAATGIPPAPDSLAGPDVLGGGEGAGRRPRAERRRSGPVSGGGGGGSGGAGRGGALRPAGR